MKLRDELILRCARRREATLGGLSPEGFVELEAAVRENVTAFIDAPEDAAFAEVVRACENFSRALAESEALDDEGYAMARAKALDSLKKACTHALETDPDCVDARHMRSVASAVGFPVINFVYTDLDTMYVKMQDSLSDIKAISGTLSWENVFARPYLRLLAALSRTAMACTRYRAAVTFAGECLELCPTDEVGVRHTVAIAFARLESESSLNELDDLFNHESSAWSLLARAILLYRLERYGSARRALRSYSQLTEGGAYALLRPVLLPPYLPMRPEAAPLSFDAALQAVFEAETVIADTPGFVAWAQSQPEVTRAAQLFADSRGFEWE